MKRLLQISFDIFLTSICPIIIWIALGFIVDKEISNVLIITYPLQFFYMIFTEIFSVGPNITDSKNDDKCVVKSNMLFGGFFVFLITILLVLNIDRYILFFNLETSIYHTYTIYSVFLMFFGFLMQLISQKLYYESKNSLSNKINMQFNVINLVSVIVFSIIFKNYFAVLLTVIIDMIFIFYCFCKNFKFVKLNLSIKKNIKNVSFKIWGNVGMLLIYLTGIQNVVSFGKEYLNAINFDSITSDTQWDMLNSISTVAKIDISKDNFDYKKSLKDAYKLLGLLMLSMLIMNFSLYWFYKPDLKIYIIIFVVQIIDMVLNVPAFIKWDYLQIKDNNKKHNFAYVFCRILRFLCSFLPTGFCTYIGQLVSGTYKYIYSSVKTKKFEAFKKTSS